MHSIHQLQEQIKRERQTKAEMEMAILAYADETDDIQLTLKQLHQNLEQALSEATRETEQIAKFANENPNPVIRFSFSGKLLFANASGKEILRLHPVETDNHFWIPFLQHKQLQKNKFEIEIVIEQQTILLLFSPQFERGYVNIFGRDITEIKSAQAQLIKNEIRYRQIAENGNDIFFNISETGYFNYTNPTLSLVTGYTKKELVTMRFSALVRKDYKETITKFYDNQLKERINSTYLEFPLITKDEKELWIGQNCSISTHNDGKLELISVGRDITDKINSDKRLNMATVRLSALIDNLLDGVLVEDEYGKIVSINHTFCQLLNLSVKPETLIGMDSATVSSQLEPLFTASSQFADNIALLMANKKMQIGEHLELTDHRIFERDYIPIFSAEGYLGNLWQYKDVTEKSKLQSSIVRNEEKYRSIIENMELGLLEITKDDKILAANDQFCKIAGYTSAKEFIGKKAIETFLDLDSQKIMRSQNEQRKEGNMGLYEVKINKPNDQGFSWVLICGAPLYNNAQEVIGSIGVHLDISDQKKIEVDLEEATTKAKASSKAKETFLANMSHEIRTPMNAIMGMSELLNGTNLETKQKQYIEAIRTSSNNLLAIINGVLDFSKIEAGELSLQLSKFNLKNVVDHTVNSLSYKAVEKSIMLNTDVDPLIYTAILGDPVRLSQILLNLINNSIKFTQEGSVNLICKLIENTTEFNTIMFKISDTGIGIDPLKLELLFEGFAQKDKAIPRQYGGSGLGLNICKQLVQLMGGEIILESEKGKGSIFLFTLKFKKHIKNMVDENSFQTEEKNLSGVKVLLVEDNQINQFLATTVLRQWKAEVDVAINGIYAIESLKKKQYDMILMDIQMPEMGGIEATQIIRKELNISTPIIAVTANALKGDREIYLEAGMDDYVSKPFEQNILYTKICKYLNVNPSTKEAKNETTNLTTMEKESVQLYDLSEINKISGGDKAFTKQMITIFLEQVPQSLSQINKANEERNFERIKSVAHQIKPSIDIMQIEELKKEVRFIEENAANQTNLKQLAEHIVKLNTILNKVLEQLRNDPEFNE